MICLGGFLILAGIALSPLPIPVPIGAITILGGCAILVSYCKPFRRLIQNLRHRSHRFSRSFEFASKRAPAKVKRMVHQTRPAPLHRHARLRNRRQK